MREPSFEAKALREAIQEEVVWLLKHRGEEGALLADTLESLGNRFINRIKSEGGK